MKYKKEYDNSLLDEVIKYDREKKANEKIAGRNMIVEIGCGNGHFLINKAAGNKDAQFIGIDKKNERLIRCREKQVKRGIDNVKWINGDASDVLSGMFDGDSISGIYMIFPDPWPKRKHHKNRLFKKEFLDIVYDKLNRSGFFIFVTDHDDYFEQSYRLISSDERFKIREMENLENFSVSVFGEKWRQDERTFHMVMFGKKDE